MLRFTLRQLWHRPGRGVTLGGGILVAAAGFCLLTASVTTEQANVHATVDANLWPSYDILVRPAGSTDPVPKGVAESGLVPSTYMSGIYGGITEDQVTTITHLAGVGVAAPVAVLGYVLERVQVPIDVTGYVSSGGDRLLRLAVTRNTDEGATTFPTQDESYVLITEKQFQNLLEPSTGGQASVTGSGGLGSGSTGPGPTECSGSLSGPQQFDIPYSAGVCFTGNPKDVEAYLSWSIPVLVAGIDPAAENKLDGLGGAITSGHYLAENAAAQTGGPQQMFTALPVLVGSSLYAADAATVRVESIDPGPVMSQAGHLTQGVLDSLVGKEQGTVLDTVKVSEQDAYNQMLTSAYGANGELPYVDAYWTAGPAKLSAGAGGSVAVDPVASAPPITWTSLFNGDSETVVPPVDVEDTAFRGLTEHIGLNTGDHTITELSIAGTFNPAAVKGSAESASTQASLNIYSAPGSPGADATSQAALGGQQLVPNSNLAGYLQQPPTILTTINALS